MNVKPTNYHKTQTQLSIIHTFKASKAEGLNLQVESSIQLAFLQLMNPGKGEEKSIDKNCK